MARVVLVTGVSRLVGGRTARDLSLSGAVDRVIAVDAVPPSHSLGQAQFVRADIRNPIIGKIIRQEQVDTVVHLGVITTPRQAGGRTSQKEINVIGTMQLLAACQKADTLQRLVVKSSSSVYGSSPRDPAMFTEDMPARKAPTVGFAKDSVEVETYVRGFARRRPDVAVTMLRMANVVGRGLRTPLTDYFSMRVVPVPFGYDGRVQVLHLDDAVRACVSGATSEASGIVNIAGGGFVTVKQAACLLRRPIVHVLPYTASLVAFVSAQGRIGTFDADQMSWLCYGRGMDTTRMRELLGFEPAFTTREAILDVFADPHRTPQHPPRATVAGPIGGGA
ncbi:NAD-dependent epimerase/dehydratase family protein [Luteipulveratus flavus]|uniref:NAD-dependent epimerase/dehydratase family protein n=1 Tax=Luteipulveratus flavus TaxID=3031728 RepID=A0ABT6C9C4_9MICO|nr:NAD-dependent epimerase/dehydratase family protein [Luteipulveratus sp. YIM 133296]MDF8264654.1 NAD-dependent epimerase/dehydratase family protein [Luteipulveratus sp. YIM 133296]